MAADHTSDQVFEGVDFAAGSGSVEYEQCQFSGCNFAGADLSGILFAGCSFRNCNLSNAQIKQTALRQVHFIHCKMFGLQFDIVNPFLFEVSFHHCDLSYTVFTGARLKAFRFEHCMLHEADFSGADLSNATFYHCDLAGALFIGANLEKADFSSAFHFTIDPERNKMKKAKFSAAGLEGLLAKYQLEIIP
jgi:uncharacterized protein YjbI with pentapeptide repeats